MPEREALNTVTFTEKDGRTTLTVLVQHGSKEARDAHIGSGWRRACRRGWTCWRRSRSRCAERDVGEGTSIDTVERGTVMSDENNEAQGYGQTTEPAPDSGGWTGWSEPGSCRGTWGEGLHMSGWRAASSFSSASTSGRRPRHGGYRP